jgi:hypothetical protein
MKKDATQKMQRGLIKKTSDEERGNPKSAKASKHTHLLTPTPLN